MSLPRRVARHPIPAFVAQRAVEVYGWLSPTDMVRGLALAESTPGPLIMVVQFVAFLGAYHHPGTLNPWAAGILGSLLTTWVTFVPCFLFILLGAPYVERLRHNHTLSTALTGITAAVVGVIANLGLYFTIHTLFTDTHALTAGPLHLQLPDLTSIQPIALAITAIAAVLAFELNWSMLRILGVSVILGLAATMAGLPQTRQLLIREHPRRHETDLPHQPTVLGAKPTSSPPPPKAEPGLTGGQLRLRHIRWFFAGSRGVEVGTAGGQAPRVAPGARRSTSFVVQKHMRTGHRSVVASARRYSHLLGPRVLRAAG
ncbi:chromate transporter [Nocardia sp. NPDC002869]|uniref:chromate transporter n=1 Tax=Nocardia sp. NPDC002869 TaxID=3161032 RepID=UPI00398D5038